MTTSLEAFHHADGILASSASVDDLHKGRLVISDPTNVDKSVTRLGIHSEYEMAHTFQTLVKIFPIDWAQHGISGRGVLLDMVKFYTAGGGSLPYDPWTTQAVPLKDLLECAKQQGLTFRHGDILLIRFGFTQRYYSASTEERDGLAGKPETLYVLLIGKVVDIIHKTCQQCGY